jgi:hypothetical protein
MIKSQYTSSHAYHVFVLSWIYFIRQDPASEIVKKNTDEYKQEFYKVVLKSKATNPLIPALKRCTWHVGGTWCTSQLRVIITDI